MPSDHITDLRENLKVLRGPARLSGLTMLAQALADRYWRTGPGDPAGLADLDEAVSAIAEAYGLLDSADPMRGQVATMYGILLSARHSGHRSDPSDREKAIEVLTEARRFANVPPVPALMVRLALGQMHLSRALGALQGQRLTPASLASGALSDTTEIDQAVSHLRAVATAGAVSPELSEVAQGVRTMAEAMRDLLGGLRSGVANLDLTGMMAAMAAMQKLVDEHRSRQGAGYAAAPGMPRLSFFDAQQMASAAPIDRPVTVVRGPMPEPAAAEPGPDPSGRRPFAASAEPIRVEPAQAREALHAKVRAVAAEDGADAPIWKVAAHLVRPGAQLPSAAEVDELVALSTLLAEGEPQQPSTRACDLFLHAASLLLRYQLEQMFDDTDRVAGLRSLIRAGNAVPLDDAAAVTIFGALCAFADGAGRLGEAAQAAADRIDLMIVTGSVPDPADLAVMHAVRCLCRSGAGPADALLRAVQAVPAGYPWRSVLLSAASSR